ncbi:MAG: hypothetical protein ACR2J5_00345 [Geodermatophilaceae bacterium]
MTGSKARVEAGWDTGSMHGRETLTMTSMTLEDLLQLPAVVDLPTAADVLGVGHSSAYELVRTGQWPTPVLRLGRLIRIPSAPLLALVGIERPNRQAS